MEKTAKTQ